MANSQATEGGTASNTEGNCEYFEQAVADSRQEAVLQLGCRARYQQLLIVKKLRCYETFHKGRELD